MAGTIDSWPGGTMHVDVKESSTPDVSSRAFDNANLRFQEIPWAATALGSPETWPTSTKALVQLCLEAQTPMALWLGGDFVLIHNDLYRRFLSPEDKPWLMGMGLGELSATIRDNLGPLLRQRFQTGQSLRREDQLSMSGEAMPDFVFSYSLTPIRDERGQVVGVFQSVEEHTKHTRARNQVAEFLSFTLTNAHMGTWELVNGETNVRRTPQHDQIFGYSEMQPEWNLGKFLDHLLPEDRADMSQRFSEASISGAEWAFEHRIRRADGDIRWLWSAGKHIPAHNSSPSRMIGVVQEITDRKRAEEALRASEELFRTVVETSPDAIAMLDLGTQHYVLVSPSMVQLTGFSMEELRAMSNEEVADRIHPDDRKRALKQQKAVALGMDTGPSEYRWRVKNGSYRWIYDHRKLVRDAAGNPTALVGVLRDVTERKEFQAALEKSTAVIEQERAQLNAMLDTLPVGLYVTDAHGGLLRHNEGTRRIWRGGALPRNVREYASYSARWTDSGEPVAETEWPASRALRLGEKTEGMIVDIQRFDGTAGTIVLSGAPILNEHQQVTGAVVVVQDISELRDAQKRLEEADKRKNEFLAILSHELRNPLTPMKNSLHLIKKLPPGSPQAEKAHDVMARQIRQMSLLIDDLLDVTRIATGKVKLHKELVELTQLVKHTLDDYRTLFQNSNIELHARLPEEEIFIHADSLRVAQILSNLLHNASKFTPPQGTVTVTLQADAQVARLSVSDTGTGIPRQVMNHLFEPFMQADTTLDRSRGGLGLGLALVKGLVTLHDGEISASSEGEGKGATFTLELPRSNSAPEAASTTLSSGLRKRKVLIIEDNIDAADSLRQLLELEGHVVEVALNGTAGVQKARDFQPDVAFCDIGLPGMNGYQVAQAFRADPSLRHVRLVALSGYALPEDIQRARESGFSEHVTKPPQLETLYGLIDSSRA